MKRLDLIRLAHNLGDACGRILQLADENTKLKDENIRLKKIIEEYDESQKTQTEKS